MQRHCGDFKLWVIAMDTLAEEALTALSLDRVQVISVASLETTELRLAKLERSAGEYCWTMTPFAPSAVFARAPFVERVTYLDADLWFRRNPRAIFDELFVSRKAVLLTEHAYAPENDVSAAVGRFCVQFMPFLREGSIRILELWQSQCLDWCSNSVDSGRFGDQKYLDDWPDTFPDDVHILSRPELIQGPWNATRFPYSDAVAYHFHGLRWRDKTHLDFGSHFLPFPHLQNVYGHYVSDLEWARDVIDANLGADFRGCFQQLTSSRFHTGLRNLRVRGKERFPRFAWKFYRFWHKGPP